MDLQIWISYCSSQSASHVAQCLFCLCLYHACVISAFSFGRILFIVPAHINMVWNVLAAVLHTMNNIAADNNCYNDSCSQFFSWLLVSLKSTVCRSWCSCASPVSLHDTWLTTPGCKVLTGKVVCMQPIRRLLEEKFPDMKRLETKSLHKGVAGARHTFLRQPPGQNKLDLLLQVCCPSPISSV